MPWQLHSVWQVEIDRKREGDKSAPLNIITCLNAFRTPLVWICSEWHTIIVRLLFLQYIVWVLSVVCTLPLCARYAKMCSTQQTLFGSNKFHALAWTRSIDCDFFLDSSFYSTATLFHFFTCFIFKMTVGHHSLNAEYRTAYSIIWQK